MTRVLDRSLRSACPLPRFRSALVRPFWGFLSRACTVATDYRCFRVIIMVKHRQATSLRLNGSAQIVEDLFYFHFAFQIYSEVSPDRGVTKNCAPSLFVSCTSAPSHTTTLARERTHDCSGHEQPFCKVDLQLVLHLFGRKPLIP